MSHKRNTPTEASTKDQRIAELEQERGELELELVRQRATNQRQGVAILRLQKLLERIREENEALKREGKRQAAPFARRKRVEHPKKPGRKAGQGQFRRRGKPAPQQVNETKIAKLHGCPDCGDRRLRNIHEHEQYVADIPDIQPIITRL
jgi:hypothetical protein